jgi:Na+/H+ antiporter NhaD/arsenite permease-like protein
VIHTASQVYFGLNPMWVSTCLLLVTYAVVMFEKVDRALIDAGAMVIVGVLDQAEALKGVDWNTLGLLTGMKFLTYTPYAFPMMLVSIAISHIYL